MIYRKIKYCLIVSILISINCKAQSIDSQNVKWSVTKFYYNSVNESTTHSSVFEVRTPKIEWIQKGGALVYEFTITDKTGDWPDVSKDGKVIYSVSFKGNPGTIKFERNQGEVTIVTNVSFEGKNILPYTFTVNSISPL